MPGNGTTIKKTNYFFPDFITRSTILPHHIHPYVQPHDLRAQNTDLLTFPVITSHSNRHQTILSRTHAAYAKVRAVVPSAQTVCAKVRVVVPTAQTVTLKHSNCKYSSNSACKNSNCGTNCCVGEMTRFQEWQKFTLRLSKLRIIQMVKFVPLQTNKWDF
jgi:hypothetical protein